MCCVLVSVAHSIFSCAQIKSLYLARENQIEEKWPMWGKSFEEGTLG